MHLLPKKIVLSEGSHFRWGGSGNLLSRWRSHLGAICTPYLDLRNHLPDSKPSAEAVDHFLRICSICGKPSTDRVSPMLIDLINYASEDTLRTHLQPGGKLASIEHEPIAQAAQALPISVERRNFVTDLLKEVSPC